MDGAAASPVGAWIVTGIRRDGELAPPLTGTSLTVEFDESGRVFGSAGCNRFTAGYAATDGGLEITAAASTRMFRADPPGVMEQEDAFLALLVQVAVFTRGEDSLGLCGSSGAVLIALGREAQSV